MKRSDRRRKPRRHRVGQVSYYYHHGSWHVYYREGSRQIRRRAGDSEQAAALVAAQVNARLAADEPTQFSFTPLPIAELRRKFLDHHEHVLRSSLATVSRYRAATQHLENYASATAPSAPAHLLNPDEFVRYLRALQIAPNGHAHCAKRPLRDKGIRFILETSRSLYGFAAKKRHLPPYCENPFAGLGGKNIRVEDAKGVFVFDKATELRFLQAADPWSFPIHFTLAKCGLRVGELVHLLVEDLDLAGGWIHIRNKTELGWRIKTGRERVVPLIDEVVVVLQRLIGDRLAGPVFRREMFCDAACPLGSYSRRRLAAALEERIAAAGKGAAAAPSRAEQAQLARTIWRDAGATLADRIRNSFTCLGRALELGGISCPKSWRHTFATLLQDANVDPLVRQITLGHATASRDGALGMTSVYTHTRPETQRREIFRALRLWPDSLKLAHVWANSQVLNEANQFHKEQRNAT